MYKNYFVIRTTTNCTSKPFNPKLVRIDDDIHNASALWYSDPVAVEEMYDHISKWDVSLVINMDNLFEYRSKFNEDISR